MTRYSKNEVFTILLPFHAVITRCILDAYSISKEQSNGFQFPRTSSNVMYDNVIQRLMETLKDNEKVRTKVENGTRKFLFDSRVIARFKKSGRNKLGHNIPTKADDDYIDINKFVEGFPPEAVKVEVTWEIDKIENCVKNINVVARNGSYMLWSYPIYEGADLVNMQTVQTETRFDEKPIIVRPKKSDIKRTENG
ncbi:unnamed protein product [Bartonella apis]|uniref:hypothetical protein n=1 Tax=Bartonella apis TaxID=1686310 RepID=UPI003997E84F